MLKLQSATMKLLTIIFLFTTQVYTQLQQPLKDHVTASVPQGDGISSLLSAMSTMQTQFWQSWVGTWPNGIDWTRAVLGTHITAGIHAYSHSLTGQELQLEQENVINGYFSHIIAYYFGQDAIAIRDQAFDDMLWVVLGWLDGVRFLQDHSHRHFSRYRASAWYGQSFSSAFAHRARVFWELAAEGWDDTLCGGGMNWNPRLTPYKNAITNELFIAASINMYLYFPGDDNDCPFAATNGSLYKKHDIRYLDTAVKGYDWLKASNMTNKQGLYIDGFHISGWNDTSNGTQRCDVPSASVYTYNQGVILSGQRGLWSATGDTRYLEAGHELIRNVIAATGWHLASDSTSASTANERWKWHGLGRNGVLEDLCDAGGYCSQDGQTFKGIFFHHLAAFCSPLPLGKQSNPFHGADKSLAWMHLQSCREYTSWVERNARAAIGTKDDQGVMGMWWTVGLENESELRNVDREAEMERDDYRNRGLPQEMLWGSPAAIENSTRFKPVSIDPKVADPNERGRGRTVESHSGGVAVLRAQYEFQTLANIVL